MSCFNLHSIILSCTLFSLHFLFVDSFEYGMIAYFTDKCPDGWEQYQQSVGRVIIGAGSATDSRGEQKVFILGDKGGSFSHVMSISELARHFHNTGNEALYNIYGGGTYVHKVLYASHDIGWDQYNNVQTSSVGEGQPFNIMQPYIALLSCKYVLQKDESYKQIQQDIKSNLGKQQNDKKEILEQQQKNKEELQQESQKNKDDILQIREQIQYQKGFLEKLEQQQQQQNNEKLQSDSQKNIDDILQIREQIQYQKGFLERLEQQQQQQSNEKLQNNSQKNINEQEKQQYLEYNQNSEQLNLYKNLIIAISIILVSCILILVISIYLIYKSFQKKTEYLEEQLKMKIQSTSV